MHGVRCGIPTSTEAANMSDTAEEMENQNRPESSTKAKGKVQQMTQASVSVYQ